MFYESSLFYLAFYAILRRLLLIRVYCYHSIIAIFLQCDSIGELNSNSDESAQLLMIITHKMTLKMSMMSLTTRGEDVDPILLSIATP